MLYKINKIWKKYGFEIILRILCIFYSYFRPISHKVTGKKGTWSKQYYSQLSLL